MLKKYNKSVVLLVSVLCLQVSSMGEVLAEGVHISEACKKWDNYRKSKEFEDCLRQCSGNYPQKYTRPKDTDFPSVEPIVDENEEKCQECMKKCEQGLREACGDPCLQKKTELNKCLEKNENIVKNPNQEEDEPKTAEEEGTVELD